MKKTIAILLVLVMALSLCACGGNGKNGGNGTELTLDNYTDYLKIKPYAGKGGELIEVEEAFWLGRYNGKYKEVHDDFFVALIGGISSESVSPNFNYSNVKVTVRFAGTVLTIDRNSDPDNPEKVERTFEFEGTFALTAGGTDKDETITYDLGNYMIPGGAAAYSEFEPNCTYEIIDISGMVTPA